MKPSRRIVFVTGVESPSSSQKTIARQVAEVAMKNKCLLLVGDRDGIEAEIIRTTNKAKYEKVIVWGASGVCRYLSNFGHNELAFYGPKERDDVCAARSGTLITIGKAKRFKAIRKFANDIGHRVVEK